MMRTSRMFLLAGMATLAASGAALGSGLLPDDDEPARRGRAQTFNGTSVPLDPSARDELAKRAEVFNADCSTNNARTPSKPHYRWVLDAVAGVTCTRSQSGVETIYGWRFADPDPMINLFWALDSYNDGVRGTCAGGSGATGWVTREGDLGGRVLCYISDKGEPAISWTEDRTNTLFLALGNDSEALKEWWERTLRPQDTYPTAAEQKLVDMVEARVDGVKCGRDYSEGSPLGDAALWCASAGIDDTDVYLESLSPSSLGRYLRDTFRDQDLASIPVADDACQKRSFQRGVWSDDGGVRGTVACFPAGDERVLIWTLDAIGLYGYVSASSPSPQKLYKVWNDKLSRIGL